MGDVLEAGVREIKDLLIGGRLDRVQQIDRYSYLLNLYSLGENWQLLVSLKKSSPRFHLLFDVLHKSYLFTSAETDIMKKYCVGRRINGLVLERQSVELVFPQVSVAFNFLSCNFTITDRTGSLIYRTASSVRGREAVQRIPLEKSALKVVPSLSLNRSLSQEFFSDRQQLMRNMLIRLLRTEQRKQKRLGEKLARERDEMAQKDKYKLFGELIKYNLASVPKGKSAVLLRDFEGREVRVALNPALDPKENMSAYFRKYRKLKKREEIIGERIAEQERKLGMVKSLMDELERPGRIDLRQPAGTILGSIEDGALGRRVLRRIRDLSEGKRGEQSRTGFLKCDSRSGKGILVGRNARENDELTLRIARGNDLWFHAESVPGSHVILKYEKVGQFLEEDIEDAAQLALHFSALRREGNGNIIYTRRKYVNKPKGASAGVVVYRNEKSRWVSLDSELVSRLLARAE